MERLRAGDWFYMIASSFNCTPGLPVLRSPDLVNWELTGSSPKLEGICTAKESRLWKEWVSLPEDSRAEV